MFLSLQNAFVIGFLFVTTDKNVEGKEQRWKGMEVPPVTSVSALPCCLCVSGALPGALPRPRGTEFSW